MSDPRYRDIFTSLGMLAERFGTCSTRKGTVMHVTTGSTVDPPIPSICIRADWGIPVVTSCYIKYENADNQFVGKGVLE